MNLFHRRKIFFVNDRFSTLFFSFVGMDRRWTEGGERIGDGEDCVLVKMAVSFLECARFESLRVNACIFPQESASRVVTRIVGSSVLFLLHFFLPRVVVVVSNFRVINKCKRLQRGRDVSSITHCPQLFPFSDLSFLPLYFISMILLSTPKPAVRTFVVLP